MSHFLVICTSQGMAHDCAKAHVCNTSGKARFPGRERIGGPCRGLRTKGLLVIAQRATEHEDGVNGSHWQKTAAWSTERWNSAVVSKY